MNSKGKTVLLVDDDPDFLEQHRVLLESMGFQVVCASGRKEGEDLLEKTRPDVAILDLMMEEGDGGFVLAHKIKNRNSSIPVIIVTSVTHDTGMEFALDNPFERSWIKADALLAKPVRFEQLKKELERLVR